MITATRDERIKSAMPLLNIASTKFKTPIGLNRDDLISAAQPALVEAAYRWDEASGMPWKNYAYQQIKFAMRTLVHRHKQCDRLQPEINGEWIDPPIDRKAADPSAIVEARQTLSLGRLKERLPPPSVVSARVSELQQTMFDAISTEDVKAIMGSVVGQAKHGNLKAAKFVMDLINPKPPTHVKQNIVVVNPEDVD